jgi:hypothetical protein
MRNYTLFVMMDDAWIEVTHLQANDTASAYRTAADIILSQHAGLPFALSAISQDRTPVYYHEDRLSPPLTNDSYRA